MSDPGFQNYIESILKRNDTVRHSKHYIQEDGTSRVSTAARTSRTITSSRTMSTGTPGSQDETIHTFNVSITATLEPFTESEVSENGDGDSVINKKPSDTNLEVKENFKKFVREPSFYQRLSIKRNESMEYLKTITKRPKILKPEPDLPIWSRIPLENKIPLLTAPSGSVKYSRGRMCQELVLGKKNGYQEASFELHEDKAVDLTYNALHDPHAKGYLLKPIVQKQLIDQGLITPQGKVLCNYQEFNQYRAYISNLYSADLGTSLQLVDKQRIGIRELKEEVEAGDIPEEKKKNVIRERKLAQAREKARKLRKRQERRCQELVKMREDREKQIELGFEQKKLDMSIKCTQREFLRNHKLHDQRLFFHRKRVNVYTAMQQKEKQFNSRVLTQRNEMEGQKARLAKGWLKKWKNYEDRSIDQDRIIEQNRERMLDRSDSRQSWHIRQWTASKETYEIKRRMTNRIAWLSMKYFHIWKANVKKILTRLSPSARLESRWNVRTDIQDTIQGIRTICGIPSLINQGEVQRIGPWDADSETMLVTEDANVASISEHPLPEQAVGGGEPELTGRDKVDMTFILKGILHELNDRTVDMNLRIVARAVLKSLTDEARKQCMQVCSEIRDQIPQDIIEDDDAPEDPSGDGQNVMADVGNDLETIFQGDGKKSEGVALETSQDRIFNSNAPSGDWQMPKVQIAEDEPKPEESVSVSLIFPSESNPRLLNQNSEFDMVSDVFGHHGSDGDSDWLAATEIDTKSEHNSIEILTTSSHTSFDSVENSKSLENLQDDEEQDSDSSESDSSVISMEMSKETTEALRRDREGQMSFLRSRPSRINTGLPDFIKSNTDTEADDEENVEKYISNIMKEVKEFTESDSVLDIQNRDHKSSLEIPSNTNLNKEPDIVPPNSIFSSNASYMDFVSNFETTQEEQTVEEPKIDVPEVKAPTNNFFKQLLEKGLRSTSTKNQDYILDDQLPEPLPDNVGMALNRIKSLRNNKGKIVQEKNELQLYVQRFFEVRKPHEIRSFLDRIQEMEDPNEIAEHIKNERIKLDADIQTFRNTKRKVKVKTEASRELSTNPIYKWLKPKSIATKPKKITRPKLKSVMKVDLSKKAQINSQVKTILKVDNLPPPPLPPKQIPSPEKSYEIRTVSKQKIFSQTSLGVVGDNNQFSITKSKKEGYSKVTKISTETNEVLKPLPPLKKVRFENFNSAADRAAKLREMANRKIRADAATATIAANVNPSRSHSRPSTANANPNFRPVSILVNSRPNTPVRVISTSTRTTEFSQHTSSGHKLFYKTSNKPTGANVFRTDEHTIKSSNIYRLNSSSPLRATTANSQSYDDARFHIDAMNRISPPFSHMQNQRFVLPPINVPRNTSSPMRSRPSSAIPKLPPIIGRQPQGPISDTRMTRAQNLTPATINRIEQKRLLAEKSRPQTPVTCRRPQEPKITRGQNLTPGPQKMEQKRTAVEISRPQTPVPPSHDQILNQHVLPIIRRRHFQFGPKPEMKKFGPRSENNTLKTIPKIDTKFETKSCETSTSPIVPEKTARPQPQVKPYAIHRRRVKNMKSIPGGRKLVPSEETINETLKLLQTILFFRAVDEVKDSLKMHNPIEFPSNLVKKLYQTSTTSLARMTLMLSQAYVRRDKSKIGKILREFEFGVHKLSTFVSALVISNVREGQPLSTPLNNIR